MFRRFAAASAVASLAIAVGSVYVLVVPSLGAHRAYPLSFVWCFGPVAWGLWAWLAPASWVPQKLPIWGAILGFIAGMFAAFVLNLPTRIFGQPTPIFVRFAGVVALVAAYYFCWMAVAAAYRTLEPHPSAEKTVAAKAA